MGRYIVGLLATVGALVLLAVAGGVAFIASGPFSPKPLPRSVVLSLDLRDVPRGHILRPAARRPVPRSRRRRSHPASLARPTIRALSGTPRSATNAGCRVQSCAVRPLPRQGQVHIGLPSLLGGKRQPPRDYYSPVRLQICCTSGGFASLGSPSKPSSRARDARGAGEGGKRRDTRAPLTVSSETGYRSRLREPAAASTVFLASSSPTSRDRARAGEIRRLSTRPCSMPSGAQEGPSRPDRLSRRRPRRSRAPAGPASWSRRQHAADSCTSRAAMSSPRAVA